MLLRVNTIGKRPAEEQCKDLKGRRPWNGVGINNRKKPTDFLSTVWAVLKLVLRRVDLTGWSPVKVDSGTYSISTSPSYTGRDD